MRRNDNDFNFFIPASFEKGKRKGKDVVRVKGIASSSTAKDSDGETLFPDGFDYSPLLQKGFLNWDHQQKGRPAAIIGEPDVARVINGGRDFYIEGFLYSDSKEAQDVAQLAQVLEKNSPTRRLGYSIEGQVLERGCGPQFLDEEKKILNPNYDPVLWKQVKKARITGVAITPCPKNPNTVLSLVKGEYNDLYVEHEDLGSDMTMDVESNSKLTIVKSSSEPIGTIHNGYKKIAEGKWRKVSKDGLTKEEHKQKGKEYGDLHNKYAKESGDRPKHPSYQKTVDNYVLSNYHYDRAAYLDNKDYSDKEININKAMTAEGASTAGLLPEHVEGHKNPNKAPMDKSQSVGSYLTKSEVYNFIGDHLTDDLVKAKQIFHIIKTINEKSFNMQDNMISQESIDKALLLLKSESGSSEGSSEPSNDVEKAKEKCSELMKGGMSSEEAEAELVKSGFTLEASKSAVESIVSAMSNLKENGDKDTGTHVSPEERTGADLPLKKGEEDGMERIMGAFGSLEKSIGTKFASVGQLLSAALQQNKTLTEQNEILKSQFDELNEKVERIGDTPLPRKSVTKVNAMERFAKSESGGLEGLTKGTQVYDLDDSKDRELLSKRVQVEIEKSRNAGQTPLAALENIIAGIEMTKTIMPEHVGVLASYNVAVTKNGNLIR